MLKNNEILEPKKDADKSFVYLLGDFEKPGVYKIGVTRGALSKRIKKLQTGNSGEIYICKYYQTEYPFYIEQQLHHRYAPNNVKNEWFEISDEEFFKFEKTCKFFEELIEILKENPFFAKNIK